MGAPESFPVEPLLELVLVLVPLPLPSAAALSLPPSGLAIWSLAASLPQPLASSIASAIEARIMIGPHGSFLFIPSSG